MGAKFRETPPCKKNKLTYLYRDAIEQLTKKVARSTKRKIIIFDSWKHNIIQEIDKVLTVRQYMNYLHDRFVVVLAIILVLCASHFI